MTPPSGARPYRSPLRRAQADATRAGVLDAAAALFVRQGYLRTTMKDIATEAGTSVETVYAQGAKSALLLACVDRALAGDEDDVPMTDRPDFTAALTQPTAEAVIDGFVRALTAVIGRAGGLLVAFEDAAAADPATAAMWATAEQHRRVDVRRLVEAVAQRGTLAHGWDIETATDAVWLVLSPRPAHTALRALGWSPQLLGRSAVLQVSALLLPSTSGT